MSSRSIAAASVVVLTLTLLASASAAPASGAQYWPQWRGPLGNGLAPQADPPVNWSESQNVKWKAKLPGKGSSTPIVWDNLIFIQTAILAEEKSSAAAPPAPQAAEPGQPGPGGPGGFGRRGGRGGFGQRPPPTDPYQFVLLCIDRRNGTISWQKTAQQTVPHEAHHQDHGYASHSPVTDGRHVYAYFGSRGLHCYDLKGNLQWSKDFGQMRTANTFGEGSSPTLAGDKLIVNWDHEGEDFIAAFDKATGQEIWRNARDERTTWTTPFVLEYGGRAQVVVAASGRVRSYDLANGKLIWECGGLGSNVVPTPVTGHDMIFAMSGHREPALLAIKLGGTGDLTDSDAVVWKVQRGIPYVPSSLLYGENLFTFNRNDPLLYCYEAKTGKPLIDGQRLTGPSGFYASLAGAQDRIYAIGRNGTSLVLKNSSQFEILATNTLDDGFDASPAVVGNQLILRGHEYLYCLAAN